MFWVDVALRQSFAELDAINLYEQMATLIERIKPLKESFSTSLESKKSMGEFLALLLREDQEKELIPVFSSVNV